MQEVKIKTHLIITDIHEEYHINWCGKIKDTKPKFKCGKPIFVIISASGRIELNTTDMKYIERSAAALTKPRGRQAVTTDTAKIYIKEADGRETLLGVLTHNHVKTFAPMYDSVYCK